MVVPGNVYYLHFSDATDLVAVSAAFEGTGMDVEQRFPSSFQISGPMSFSKVQHILDVCFSADDFIVCKIKALAVHAGG